MKHLLLLGLLLLSSASVHAAYLYWQTGSDASFHGNDITGYNIYAVSAGGEKTQLTDVSWTDMDPVDLGADAANGYYADSEYVVDIGDLSDTSSFYIEVVGYDSAAYGDNPGVIGKGETVSYSDLVSNGSIQGPGIAVSIPQMWTGGAISIPEPTSGLMLLFGLACVGLKRRKV